MFACPEEEFFKSHEVFDDGCSVFHVVFDSVPSLIFDAWHDPSVKSPSVGWDLSLRL